MNNNLPPQNVAALETWLNWVCDQLQQSEVYYGHGTDNVWDEAVQMTLFCANLPADSDDSVLSCLLSVEQGQQLVDLTVKRIDERIPLPYLLRQAWFAGMPFYVDERVLIPRSPIAECLEQACQPWVEPEKIHRILDIGTGSACIAIVAALAFPEAEVDAVDIDPDALAVAAINVNQYKLQDRVRLLQSDVFSQLDHEKYDLILSNPPYVDPIEKAELPSEYHHEPAHALFANDAGLDIAIRIVREAALHLNPGGVLILEVGQNAPQLLAHFQAVSMIELELAHGGDGVLLMTAEQLQQLR